MPTKNVILGLPTSHQAGNATAARSVRPASSLDKWAPKLKPMANYTGSNNVLRVAPMPKSMPDNVRACVGKRRDRLLVMGYAEDQGTAKGQAKWVVRCDCGNYEHRTRILRWLGTHCGDMCRECQRREYIKAGGYTPAAGPAVRETV